MSVTLPRETEERAWPPLGCTVLRRSHGLDRAASGSVRLRRQNRWDATAHLPRPPSPGIPGPDPLPQPDPEPPGEPDPIPDPVI